jgi:hypothetical protein
MAALLAVALARRQGLGRCKAQIEPLSRGYVEPEAGFEPSTFRLGVGCSASAWTAPDGSSLLTLPAPSVQTAPDRPRPTVRMIIEMIKAHPTQHRMPRKQDPSGKAVAQPRAAARPSPGLRSPARALTFRATAPPSDEATERAGARRDRPDEGAARASRRPRLAVAGGAGHGPLLGETTSSA